MLKDGEIANLNVNRQGVWWECPRFGGEGCLACARMEQPGCRGKKQEQICCGPLDENLRSCVRCWNGDNFQVLVAYDLCDTTAYSFSRLVINPSSLCLGGGGESSVVKGQGSDWFLGRAHPGSYLSTRPSSRLVRCSDIC